jgi:hypothetical protein
MKNKLKMKWLPKLQVRRSFTQEEIEEFNRDVKMYKKMHPNWNDESILI